MIKYYLGMGKHLYQGWEVFFKTGMESHSLKSHYLFLIYLTIPLPQFFLKKANQIFFEQLYYFHQMGFSLLKSLEMIYQSAKPCFPIEVVKNIHSSLENGHSLQASLRLQANYFSPVILAFLDMAHHSGNFFELMHLWFEHEKRLQSYTHQIRQQLAYPALLIVVLALVLYCFFSNTFIQYQAFAKQVHIPLPQSLQLLESLQSYALWIPLIPMTLFIYRKKIICHLSIKRNFDWWIWSASMKIFLQSGISWLDALHIIEKHFKELHLLPWLQAFQIQLRQGHPFETCFTKAPDIIRHYLPLLKVAPDTAPIFSHLADYFLREFEKSLSKIERYAQPFLLLLIAGFIGISLGLMYQPLFEMGLNL
jgi:type II secretory pathway component PulF